VARGQRRVHLPQDLVVVGGLHQHARHTVRLRERLCVLAAEIGGIEHERGVRRGGVGLQAPRQLVAVHHRHEHVRNHQLGPGLLRAGEGLAAIIGAHHFVPGMLEQGGEGSRGFARLSSATRMVAIWNGQSSRKVVPAPAPARRTIS
jgi:hypothetical protein